MKKSCDNPCKDTGGTISNSYDIVIKFALPLPTLLARTVTMENIFQNYFIEFNTNFNGH